MVRERETCSLPLRERLGTWMKPWSWVKRYMRDHRTVILSRCHHPPSPTLSSHHHAETPGERVGRVWLGPQFLTSLCLMGLLVIPFSGFGQTLQNPEPIPPAPVPGPSPKPLPPEPIPAPTPKPIPSAPFCDAELLLYLLASLGTTTQSQSP